METSVAREPAVDSRWWYWIAAYPLLSLLVVPLFVVIVLVGIVPFVILGWAEPPMAIGVVWMLILLAGGGLVVILLMGMLGIFLMLPIALYVDATAVNEADLQWKPDPLLYALVAVLQFFVTPLVGLLVSLYYLYRRHEAVGTP